MYWTKLTFPSVNVHLFKFQLITNHKFYSHALLIYTSLPMPEGEGWDLHASYYKNNGYCSAADKSPALLLE